MTGKLQPQQKMGMAVPNYQKSIIRRVTPLLSSAYKLSGKRHLENGGSFSISLSQPLRVGKRQDLTQHSGRSHQSGGNIVLSGQQRI